MAERAWQEVGANRAEVTSALEAVAANNAQLVAWGNAAFEQRDRALRQTVREEFDGYRAHLAIEMQEDIPAHVEARIADVCDFFREQFNEGARRVEQHAREHCEMCAAALREEAHCELISVEGSSASRQARVQEELVRARHGEEHTAGLWRIEMANARAQAATEQSHEFKHLPNCSENFVQSSFFSAVSASISKQFFTRLFLMARKILFCCRVSLEREIQRKILQIHDTFHKMQTGLGPAHHKHP